MQQKKEVPKHKIDRHRQHYYYGLHSTNVTQHLGCTPPSHSYSRALRHAPPPSYHRKSSSITENVLGAVHVKRFDPSLPAPWYNRQATDVTEQLRLVPPAHAAGSSKPDPWYGRSRTYVTNPDVDDYSMYQVKRDEAPKGEHEGQQEPEGQNAGEAANAYDSDEGLEDWQKEEKEWAWNGGHKIYYPENGGQPFCQNWEIGKPRTKPPPSIEEEVSRYNSQSDHNGTEHDFYDEGRRGGRARGAQGGRGGGRGGRGGGGHAQSNHGRGRGRRGGA
ncbi:hypothetical protein GOP47_0014526 [Adiantum capillus-veneris]|nr:hypothetical protein GOP47_0014526 [Adiantum capillus-veneris]